MMDGCVSVVTRQNTTRNEKEHEGGKQSSHQHKSSSMQASLKAHIHREKETTTSISTTAVVMGEKAG